MNTWKKLLKAITVGAGAPGIYDIINEHVSQLRSSQLGLADGRSYLESRAILMRAVMVKVTQVHESRVPPRCMRRKRSHSTTVPLAQLHQRRSTNLLHSVHLRHAVLS
jgi:hypothetical protein